MGGLTEEQLLQMVRDFIELESETMATSKPIFEIIHKPTCLALQEILWEVIDIEVEIFRKIQKCGDEGASATHLKMLLTMKLRMDGYEACLCKTSWLSSFNRPKVFQFTGDYEYIDVMKRDKNMGGKATRLIVDMDFRSQFEVAKPTRAYKELTDMLPSIFVGTEAKLTQIISLLCSAAKKSLKEKGLHIPPWRKDTYMRSKWLSKDCRKISFTPNFELENGKLRSEY